MSNLLYDAGNVGVNNGRFFGFPFDPEEADIIFLAVPWGSTTSYRRGTNKGPEEILKASTQMDFFSFEKPFFGLLSCATDLTLTEEISNINSIASPISKKIIKYLEKGFREPDRNIIKLIDQVNEYSYAIDGLVQKKCEYWLSKNKYVVLVGGEHSITLGHIIALSKKHRSFGVLQIDAHADLRDSYQGFDRSHASIMYNVLKVEQIDRLIQVGIRDVSEKEMEFAENDERVKVFSDYDIKNRLFSGGCWFEICSEIVSTLPENVYISFDIDGLSPQYCPNTGTPVQGGLTVDEALYLIRMISESGRKIIGADLCEVAPGSDELNGIIAARLLYRMAVLILHSNYPTDA